MSGLPPLESPSSSNDEPLPSPVVLSSSLGPVILKRRPRSSAIPLIAGVRQSSQRMIGTIPAAPRNAASLAISKHAVGSIQREWAVLSWLHSRGVRCVPSFAFFSSDPSNDALETEWKDSSEWKPLTAALNNLTSSAVMQSMLASLRELHAAGLSHGDLKSDHVLIREKAAAEPSAARSSTESASAETAECCFVDFDLSAPSAAPPFLGHFVGSPVYASVLQHLGQGPSPAADAESLLWTFAEACMQQKVQADWLLPWNRNRPRDSAGQQDADALFSRLVHAMQDVSGDFSSLHRVAACKVAVILGQTRPAEAFARADDIFAQCMACIRSEMLQLLQAANHVDPPLVQFATMLQSILSSEASSSSASARAAVIAPSPSLVWTAHVQTRLERDLRLTLTAVGDHPLVNDESIFQRVDLPAPAPPPSVYQPIAVLLPTQAVLYLAPGYPLLLRPIVTAHVLFVHRPQGSSVLELWTEDEDPDEALLSEPNAHWLLALQRLEADFVSAHTTLAEFMQFHVLWQLPDDAALPRLHRFFCALLSSGRLLSLPHVHLAILMGRFGLVLREAQLGASQQLDAAEAMDADHAAAMMLESLRRKPEEESPPIANRDAAKTEHANKKARTQQ